MITERETKHAFKKNIKPNKLLGQHFLIDDAVLKRIVDSANIEKENAVLEVGPGLGILTRALAKKTKKIIAVEKDPRLAKTLQERLAEEKIKNVLLITKDILHFNPKEHGLQKGQYKIVANLPYYLSARFLKKFLTDPESPEAMTLLIQKEVAERIVARPPRMSLLALSVQIYAKPEIICEVSKNSFYPKPKVDSALITLSEISQKFFKENKLEEKIFWKLAKAGFSQKRKTLANNLSGALNIPKGGLEQILTQAKINPRARAESLSLTQWATIATILKKPYR